MSKRDSILAVDTLTDPPGVEIVDQIERLRDQLWTTDPVSPDPIDPDTFHFPVSRAFAVSTQTLSFPTTVSTILRDDAGGMIADVSHLEAESVDEGGYIIELDAQIKTYIEVRGPMEITSDLIEKEIRFGEQQRVRIGVRSRHEQPAATVTTTDDPRDMMAAVSTFGSALKSTSPERSYPTLRGHPPSIEIGETLDVPAVVQPPDTGVRIEIPETYEAIYTTAPLAYYLGAELEPGAVPRLVTADGFEHTLDSPNGFETAVERTLKQLFILDCVTRVDGLYNIDLHERNVIEDRVDLDFASLYDRPLPEQVERYLSVPYEQVEDCIPRWRLTTHVRPVPRSAEQLPYVINGLSSIRIADSPGGGEQTTGVTTQPARGESGFTRTAMEPATRATDEQHGTTENYVEPEQTDALEQAWIGEGVPIGATKILKQAFENRFDREKVSGDISITIVVNDSRMSEERNLVNEVYGDREDLPFDVTVHNTLSVSELRSLFGESHSFFHYIGHVEERGFHCEDGFLDAATLNSTGVDSFMLNACSSYRQGLNLIDTGAMGGIVTLNEVINDEAVKIGEIVARLLNIGFPLDTALSLAREESVLGGQYTVVGSGGVTVTQQKSRTPHLIEISGGEEEFAVDVIAFASNEAGLGSIFCPHVAGNTIFFVGCGEIDRFKTSPEQLDEFLDLQSFPVKTNNKLCWSSSTTVSDL